MKVRSTDGQRRRGSCGLQGGGSERRWDGGDLATTTRDRKEMDRCRGERDCRREAQWIRDGGDWKPSVSQPHREGLWFYNFALSADEPTAHTLTHNPLASISNTWLAFLSISWSKQLHFFVSSHLCAVLCLCWHSVKDTSNKEVNLTPRTLMDLCHITLPGVILFGSLLTEAR